MYRDAFDPKGGGGWGVLWALTISHFMSLVLMFGKQKLLLIFLKQTLLKQILVFYVVNLSFIISYDI